MLLFALPRVDTGLDKLDEHLVGAQPPVAGDPADLLRNGRRQCHALTRGFPGDTTRFGGHVNSLAANCIIMLHWRFRARFIRVIRVIRSFAGVVKFLELEACGAYR
jgi:hypothetical protein